MRSLIPVVLCAIFTVGMVALSIPSTVGSAQVPTHDPSHWHAPGFGHEHGDAPPSWVLDAGYTVAFDEHGGFHGNTSARENTDKHEAMKGFEAQFGSQKVYIRTHIQSNVRDRSARYHSNEIWLLDAAGGVSHWQGWMNSGDPNDVYDPATQSFKPASGRISKSKPDPGTRPLVMVVDSAAAAIGATCEQWYVTNSYEGWGPDIGWTICGANTIYFPGEAYYTDFETFTCDYPQYGQAWQKPACLGSRREIEFSWFGPGSKISPNRGNPVRGQKFWATQFGERVSGPTDPKCATGQQTTRNGVTAQNICLDQYISPGAVAIENRSDIPNFNKAAKDFDVTGAGPHN